MTSLFEDIARPRIGAYAAGLDESWAKAKLKRSHVRRKLRAIENVLAVGSFLFREVRTVERQWLGQVVSGQRPYAAQDEQVIRAMYAEWMEPVAEVRRKIAELRPRVRMVSGAKTFERQAAVVARILDAWPNHREPRPVRMDESGRLFEIDGRPIHPGLSPEGVLAGIADMQAGRHRPLREFLAERRADVL